MKNDLKEKAIELRKQGYSYNLILQRIPVSKSTLSLWLRDIKYEPNKKVRNRIKGARINLNKWQNQTKKRSLEKAQKAAKQMVGNINERDLLMLGMGIYIGEGAKTHGRTRIINSDPAVIVTSIEWFTRILNVPFENLKLSIHLYPDNNIKESLEYWSNITNTPLSQFGKTQVDLRVKKNGKRGLLKHGTAHLSVSAKGKKEFGVFLFRKINAMINESFRQII